MKPSLRLVPRRPVSNVEIQAYAKEIAPEIEQDERAELSREGWEAVWTLVTVLCGMRLAFWIFGGKL